MCSNKSESNVKLECGWTPDTFEEEIQAIQPEYDLVLDRYGSRPATLIGSLLNESIENGEKNDNYNAKYNDDIPETFDSPEENIRRERDTVAMMRNLGIESSLGGVLNSKKSLPTHQTKSKIVYEKERPIILDESYFQFKNMRSISNNSPTNSATTEKKSVNSISCSTSSGNLDCEEELSPIEKKLRIKIADKKTIPSKTVEEKYMEEFPCLENSVKKKNMDKFFKPEQAYIKKKILKINTKS